MEKISFLIWFLIAAMPSVAVTPNANVKQPSVIVEKCMTAVSKSNQEKILNAEVESEKAIANQAWSELGPKLNLRYTNTFYNHEVFETPDSGSSFDDDKHTHFTRAGVVLRQPLIGLYEGIEKIGAEDLDWQISKANAEKENIHLIYKCMRTYVDAAFAVSRQVNGEQFLQRLKTESNRAQTAQRSGRTDPGDLADLEWVIANTDLHVTQSQLLAATSKSDLETFGNLPITSLSDFGNLVERLSKINKNKMEKTAVHQRLDMKIASLQSERQKSETAILTSRYLPKLDFFAAHYRNLDPDIADDNIHKKVTSFGLLLDWQIWDNGSRRNLRQSSLAQEQKYTQLEGELKKSLLDGIAKSAKMLKVQFNMLQLSQVGLSKAKNFHELENTRFAGGYSKLKDLMTAENALYQANMTYLQSLHDLLLINLELQEALGERKPQLSLEWLEKL